MAYRIDYSTVLLRRVDRLEDDARAAGQEEAFTNAMENIHIRLATNPHLEGELKYRTPLGFPVYSAGSGPVSINYVVYDSHQTVCITKVERFGSASE